MLRITKFLLRIVGLIPEECAQMPTFCWIKSCCAVVTAAVRFFSPYIDSADDSSNYDVNTLNYVTILVVDTLIQIEMFTLIFNKNKIIKLILNTEQLESSPKTSRESLEIATYWQSRRDSILKWITIAIFFSASVNLIDSLLREVSDAKEDPWYGVLYSVDIMFYCLSTCYHTAAISLLVIFVHKVCEELQLLKLMIKNSKTEDLIEIVKTYSLVLEYGSDACKFMSVILSTWYYLYIILIIFTVTLMKLDSSTNSGELFTNEIIFISIIYLVCRPGEMITRSSEDLVYELNQSNLTSINEYESNVRNMKINNFLLMRAQKSVKITTFAMKEMNRRLFSRTLKFIYSLPLLIRSI